MLFDLPVVGVLDSPEPCEGCGDQGGPVLVPPTGGGGAGGGGSSGGEAPNLPLNVDGGEGNCFSGDGTVALVATGGTQPYSWSTTVGTITQGSGGNATLNPPTNTNPTYGGSGFTAYGKCASWCCVFVNCSCSFWNCAGEKIVDCAAAGCATCCTDVGLSCSCSSCSGCNTTCCGGDAPGCSPADPLCTLPCCGGARTSTLCSCLSSTGRLCDERVQADIDAGCLPCAPEMNDGAVVTVTDATGQSASISISYSTAE